jgi:hypothetical protein
MTSSRLVALIALLAAAGAAVSGCIIGGHTRRSPRPGDLDFRLGPFTYIEEGKLIGLMVGAEAARYREKEKYVPLAVGLVNKNAPTLKVTRESFVLQDESGTRYPMATLSEVAEGYGKDVMDRGFTSSFDMFRSHFPTYERVSSNFFPARTSGGIVIDRVELPPFHYMIDLLYFPMPEGGVLNRRFELHVNATGLADEVFVKFLVE